VPTEGRRSPVLVKDLKSGHLLVFPHEPWSRAADCSAMKRSSDNLPSSGASSPRQFDIRNSVGHGPREGGALKAAGKNHSIRKQTADGARQDRKGRTLKGIEC